MNNQKGLSIIFLLFVIVFSSSSCDLVGQKTEDAIKPTTELKSTAAPEIKIEKHEFSYDGEERTYWLHIPAGLNVSQPVAAVFALHGINSNPQNMFGAGFKETAEQYKFIVIYPALETGEKTGFFRQLLSDLDSIVSIDPKRIYATGFSLGGQLSYLIACDLSDTFAAIAPVSGMVHCTSYQTDYPVSVIHIHGLADETVPFEGKNGPPAEEVIAAWVQNNDCPQSPQVEKIDDRVTHLSYAPCQDGTAVELYTIVAMSHKWPDREMNASEIIWAFFDAHPKP